MNKKYFLSVLTLSSLFLLNACSNHGKSANDFENSLIQNFCSKEFFSQNMEKVNKNDDPIYIGLNSGLIARNCGDYNISNNFFDKVEDSYKFDVDLENGGVKAAKTTTGVLVNDAIFDYDGSLYERTMVNAYKGLNFMSEGDFKNARVEFKRALLRQDKAKEYFANEIAKNKKDLEKAQKEDPNFKKNLSDASKQINEQYSLLFKEYSTSKNYTNPYISYLASIFYFMDRDYTLARDIFKEIKILNSKNKEIIKEWNAIREPNKNKKYIFVVYENGLGLIKEEFKMTIPIILPDSLASAPIALPTLKKRALSYEFLNVNKQKTTELVNLDDVVATEFKVNLPSLVTKTITSTILKTVVNAAVAKNDSTGGLLTLASNITTNAITQADLRSWRGLPKNISVVMVENNGEINIKDPNNNELFKKQIDKNKNVLVIFRSFAPNVAPSVNIIEK